MQLLLPLFFKHSSGDNPNLVRPTPRRPNGGSSSASPENMDSLEAPLTTLKGGGGGGETYELKQEIVSNSVVVQEKSGKVQRKTSNTSSTRYAYNRMCSSATTNDKLIAN